MSFSSRGLVLVLCAVAAAAQTGRRPPSKKKSEPPRVEFQLVDAHAESADGKPVSDLKASDFALTVKGEAARIEGSWRLDTAAGAIFAPTETIPLKPDQIHRTLIFVADDLGLTVGEAHDVRTALQRFLAGSMRSTDSVSIVCTSGGSAAFETLTSDRRELATAVEAIRYNADPGNEQERAAGARSALHTVVSGLGEEMGRKAVVLLTGNRALLEKPVPASLLEAADRAASVFFAVDTRAASAPPLPPDPGLGLFALHTGGRLLTRIADLSTALNTVLTDQDEYYLVWIQSPPVSAGRTQPLMLTTTRSGVQLRARAAPVDGTNFGVGASHSNLWRPQFTTPAADLRRALIDPFAPDSIPIRFTASSVSGIIGGMIEGRLFIDPRFLSFTHWLDGRITGTLDVEVSAFDEEGRSTQNDSRTYNLQLNAERLAQLRKTGVVAALNLPLRSSGPYQVRVAVRDGTSGRTGAARQFLDIAESNKGQLGIDGIMMSVKDAAEAGLDSVRVFHPHETILLRYQILNLTADSATHVQADVQIAILSHGLQVFSSKPSLIRFTSPADASHRKMTTELRLGDIGPGAYLLQIAVKAADRTATQYAWFEVE